jgi:hypothetical protein
MKTKNTYIEHDGVTFCLKNTSGSIIGFFKSLELAQKEAQSVERGIQSIVNNNTPERKTK